MSDLPFSLVGIAALGIWVPIIFAMFAFMKPRRAVIASFVIGYLFLPEFAYRFHTMPTISKVSLTAVGVVLASFVFDAGRLLSIRPRLIDLAWLVLLISPIGTSLSNGLGLMDGISNSLEILLRWGLAYWVGRAYFTDWEGLRELAMGIVLGGIAYMPLCWWEIRMSPLLHGQIYGTLFESFRSDTYLFGIHLFGFRPNVFLSNGLTVTMFMGVCALLAFWAWMTGSPKKIVRMPMGWIAFSLIVTTILCKAVGGIVLMVCGITVLLMVRWPKTRLPTLILLLAAPFYILMRTSSNWSGEVLVDAASILSHTRSDSLEFRLQNEDKLVGKAMQHPFLGWGGWGRSMVYDFDNNNTTIADGLWIITLGSFGWIGLGSLIVLVVGSSIMLWRRIPTRFWTDPACAAAVALIVVLGMYMVDSLFNATFNPLASLAVGGVATMAAVARKTFAQVPARPLPALPARRAFPVLVSNVKDIPYAYPAHRS